MSESSCVQVLWHRLMSLVDTDKLSATYGSPDPDHWREGRISGPDPWTAGILYALSRCGAQPDLVEAGLSHLLSIQDRNGAFSSERSDIETTPWTALFLALLSEGRLSRSMGSAVSQALKKALFRSWNNAALWPLPARIAALAAFAVAQDSRGVERMVRFLEEVWEDGHEVLPWIYQALWLLSLAAERVPLPPWLRERLEALFYASDLLTSGEGTPVIPVPQWDSPFVPFVRRITEREDAEALISTFAALPDEALPSLAAVVVSSFGNITESVQKYDESSVRNYLKLLGIYVSDAGDYRVVIFPSLGSFAVVNIRSGHVAAWDQGITISTSDGKRLSSPGFYGSSEVQFKDGSMVMYIRLSGRATLEVPVPEPLKKLAASGFDAVSRHVPSLRRTGHYLLGLIERRRSIPVLERTVLFAPDGVGAVDTIKLPDRTYDVSGVLLGCADFPRRLLGWYIPPDPAYFRPMTEAELALLKSRGEFQLRRRFS